MCDRRNLHATLQFDLNSNLAWGKKLDIWIVIWLILMSHLQWPLPAFSPAPYLWLRMIRIWFCRILNFEFEFEVEFEPEFKFEFDLSLNLDLNLNLQLRICNLASARLLFKVVTRHHLQYCNYRVSPSLLNSSLPCALTDQEHLLTFLIFNLIMVDQTAYLYCALVCTFL